tara:strand:- start:8283 stop:9791 length:1509 start_codon:yes stop_codon:yes gene_type:complete
MREYGAKESIIKNSFWNLFTTLINRFGGLAFTIILARYLLPEGYGIYTIIFSTTMFFFTFADLGINSTLVRYLSEALSKDKRKVTPYYRYLLKVKFILVLFIFFLLVILAYPLTFYFYNNESIFIPLLIASLFMLITAIEVFHAQIFYAIERTKYIAYREIMTQLTRIGLVFLIFYYISKENQITYIFALLAIVHLIMLGWILFYLKKLLPEICKRTKENIDKKRVRKFLKFITIASISAMFFSYVDSIMLGVFLPPEFAGYYQVAFSIIIGVASLSAFPNAILLPIFTKMDHNKIENVINKTVKYISIIAIPSSFGIIILGRYLVRALYGYDYLSASIPLYSLAPLIFPMIFVGTFLSLFSAKEKPQIFAKLILITLFINIILNLVLIKLLLPVSPLWATAGVGIATSLSWIFYFLKSLSISKKQFNLNISLRPTIKPIISSTIMTLILLYFLLSIKSFDLIMGLMLVSTGILSYISSMLLIKGIEKQDIEIMKLFFKRIP